MKRYLESTDETATTFWTITLEGTTFTTATGIVGTAGQTNAIPYTTLAEAMSTFDAQVQEKITQGYRDKEPLYRVITWEEFEQAFSPDFAIPFGDDADELNEIRLYAADLEGNIVLRGDYAINLDKNAVFAGNVIVDGTITMNCFGLGVGNFMYVQGSLRADSIVLSGHPSMLVEGNVDLKHGILGEYGDDGGYLDVLGETSAEVVVAATYFNMYFGGAVTAVAINVSHRAFHTANHQELAADYDEETLQDAMLDELLASDGRLDTERVSGYLRSGQNILKP